MFCACLSISFLGVGVGARAIQVNNRIARSLTLSTNNTAFYNTSNIPSALWLPEDGYPTSRPQSYLPSVSTDDHEPVKLQSASSTARHGGVVTSLATSRSGVPAEPQSSSLFGDLPSAPTAGVRSEGSANVTFGHETVLTSQLAASTSEYFPAATSVSAHSTNRPGHLAAINKNQSSSEPILVGLTASTEEMSDPQTTEAPQNALSVLLSALPVDVASSIEAGFSVVTHDFFATSDADTSTPTSRPTPTDRSKEPKVSTSRFEPKPTSHRTERPASHNRTSGPSLHPTTPRSLSHTLHPTSRPAERPTSHTSRTLSTRASTTTSNPPSSTTSTLSSTSSTTAAENSRPTITPERQQANGTIAGVATGAAAGVVLLTLAIFFFLRRRQRKRALQAVAAKATFPESAWLYDPVRSPPRSLSPAPQGAVGGELGMTQAQAKRSSLLAPEVVMPEGEPLLAPGRAATRDNSPNGGVRRSASPAR